MCCTTVAAAAAFWTHWIRSIVIPFFNYEGEISNKISNWIMCNVGFISTKTPSDILNYHFNIVIPRKSRLGASFSSILSLMQGSQAECRHSMSLGVPSHCASGDAQNTQRSARNDVRAVGDASESAPSSVLLTGGTGAAPAPSPVPLTCQTYTAVIYFCFFE